MPGKLLFIYPIRSTFIQKDKEIFAQDYHIVEHCFAAKTNLLILRAFLVQAFFLLGKIWGSKLIVCEFAGFHSFLPALLGKLFGKPMLIISAGTDCVSFPSFDYGNFRKQPLAWCSAMSFRWCSHIAPVHESLIRREDSYYTADGSFQGIFHFVRGLQKPYTIIPYGFDSTRWQFGEHKQPNSFITVAFIPDQKRFILKGVDLVFQLAEKLPDCTFTVVGYSYNFPGSIPENVKLVPPAGFEQIHSLCQAHQFYFQLSISEGFPNAICEAMLCGCIPIGSEVTAIPEIVGETGWILPQRDINRLAALTQQAIGQVSAGDAMKARKRIQELFSLERRKNALLALAHTLVAKKEA